MPDRLLARHGPDLQRLLPRLVRVGALRGRDLVQDLEGGRGLAGEQQGLGVEPERRGRGVRVPGQRVEGLARRGPVSGADEAAALEAGALAFLPKDQLSATVLRELWSSPARSPAPTDRRAPPSPGG